MRKDIKQLRRLAVKEAKAIKEHATKEEIDRLNPTTIDGEYAYSCVYGQMTGTCNTARAKELIEKCCEKVCVPLERASERSTNIINGSPLDFDVNPASRVDTYTSPIETLIFKGNGGNEAARLIAMYIKGDIVKAKQLRRYLNA